MAAWFGRPAVEGTGELQSLQAAGMALLANVAVALSNAQTPEKESDADRKPEPPLAFSPPKPQKRPKDASVSDAASSAGAFTFTSAHLTSVSAGSDSCRFLRAISQLTIPRALSSSPLALSHAPPRPTQMAGDGARVRGVASTVAQLEVSQFGSNSFCLSLALSPSLCASPPTSLKGHTPMERCHGPRCFSYTRRRREERGERLPLVWEESGSGQCGDLARAMFGRSGLRVINDNETPPALTSCLLRVIVR